MSRACTVCQHPDRPAIDRRLAVGTRFSALSAQYRVSEDALARHKARHLPREIVRAQEATDVRSALDVVEQLKAINSATFKVLVDARAAGRPALVLAAIDRVQKQLELQAKLLGELDERPVINLLVAPEWLTTRRALLEALEPFVEARAVVAARLRALGTP